MVSKIKSKAKKPVVSVIILNYNGKKTLRKCIESVINQDYSNHEIIVADNNSDDGSVDMLLSNFPDVKLLQNKENMGTAGVNPAFEKAKGKYIFFICEDMVLDKRCISKLLEAEKSFSGGFYGPKYLGIEGEDTISGSVFSRSFYTSDVQTSKLGDNVKEVPHMGVGLIDKKVLDKFGYFFDPDYFLFNEDMDLGLRLRIIGSKTFYVPDAIIYNSKPSLTAKKTKTSNQILFLSERNALITYLKVCSLKNLILFLPYIFSFRIINVLKDIIKLRPGAGYARLSAIIWIILRPIFIYKKRKRVQRLRKRGDDYVFRLADERGFYRNLFGR